MVMLKILRRYYRKCSTIGVMFLCKQGRFGWFTSDPMEPTLPLYHAWHCPTHTSLPTILDIMRSGVN